jgi:hypothetical protein
MITLKITALVIGAGMLVPLPSQTDFWSGLYTRHHRVLVIAQRKPAG